MRVARHTPSSQDKLSKLKTYNMGNLIGLGDPIQSSRGSGTELTIQEREAIVNVQVDGLNLESYSCRIRNNPTIVMYAVKQNGNALQFASSNLQKDKKIVAEAIKNNICAIRYVSREIVIQIIMKNGFL